MSGSVTPQQFLDTLRAHASGSAAQEPGADHSDMAELEPAGPGTAATAQALPVGPVPTNLKVSTTVSFQIHKPPEKRRRKQSKLDVPVSYPSNVFAVK